jgi:hypothetical protein
MADAKKRKLFVVGGKDRNVPSWIKAAFEVEQFDQDEGSRGRVPEPKATPDVIVVMKSWIGHKHYYDAKALAERLEVPLIEAAGGWSAAVQGAAEQELDWFLSAIEKTKDSEEVKAEKVDVVEVIDSAWRQAYDREWAARTALERRYGKDRARFEAAQERLRSVAGRETAALRVIAEVREAARLQRENLDQAKEEIRKLSDETRRRSERTSALLTAHIAGARALIDNVSAGEEALRQMTFAMKATKEGLALNLAALTNSLAEVETAPQLIPHSSVAASPSAEQKTIPTNDLAL